LVSGLTALRVLHDPGHSICGPDGLRILADLHSYPDLEGGFSARLD